MFRSATFVEICHPYIYVVFGDDVILLALTKLTCGGDACVAVLAAFYLTKTLSSVRLVFLRLGSQYSLETNPLQIIICIPLRARDLHRQQLPLVTSTICVLNGRPQISTASGTNQFINSASASSLSKLAPEKYARLGKKTSFL